MDKKKLRSGLSPVMKIGIAAILVIIPLAFLVYFETAAPLSVREQKGEFTSPVIDLNYTAVTKTSVAYTLGGSDRYVQSDSGNLFLVVNMTIKNKGYEPFSTNPYYFHALSDGAKHDFDNSTFYVDNWFPEDVSIGEIFEGTLIFQIPATTKLVTLEYDLVRLNRNITIFTTSFSLL